MGVRKKVHRGIARGFSLIEVLVVIGIIAILAGILFPVFKAATLAAKGASSISNAGQLGTAALLYAHDYDDTVVLSGSWNSADPDADPFSLTPNTLVTWPYLLNPYMKDAEATQDPLAPSNGNVLGQNDETLNDLFFPQYGINYVYLTPYDTNTDPANPAQRPVTVSMIATPSATVFATSKYAYSETRIAANGYPFFAETPTEYNSPALWTTVEAPDCAYADVDHMHGCKSSWGLSDGYENDPTILGITLPAAGANSGGVSFRGTGPLATVVFMDGKAKRMTPGALAAGTNWTPKIQKSMVTVVNAPSYIWDIQ